MGFPAIKRLKWLSSRNMNAFHDFWIRILAYFVLNKVEWPEIYQPWHGEKVSHCIDPM